MFNRVHAIHRLKTFPLIFLRSVGLGEKKKRKKKARLHNLRKKKKKSNLTVSYLASEQSELAGVPEHTRLFFFLHHVSVRRERRLTALETLSSVQAWTCTFFFSASFLKQKHSESIKSLTSPLYHLPRSCWVTLHMVHYGIHHPLSTPLQSGQWLLSKCL